MKTNYKVAAVVIGTLLPVLAFAQVNTAVNTSAAADVTVPGATASVHATLIASSTADTTRAARAKDKADQEIDRRVKALNTLLARVSAMIKITPELKTNLKTNVQNEINSFVALKAKVDADTDLATLKTDVQSITQSYRIYMLVIPQGKITAAADRMATVINMMGAVGAKLQARISAAKTAGSDTTAIEAALSDLGQKLTSAQAHAQASVGFVAPLTPDQGDKTVQASNEAAIKKAQAEIKAGVADLTAARKDIADIIKGLGTLKASASASGSTQTQ